MTNCLKLNLKFQEKPEIRHKLAMLPNNRPITCWKSGFRVNFSCSSSQIRLNTSAPSVLALYKSEAEKYCFAESHKTAAPDRATVCLVLKVLQIELMFKSYSKQQPDTLLRAHRLVVVLMKKVYCRYLWGYTCQVHFFLPVMKSINSH